ncbi:MAG: DegT/DnrJ/EryC1/StrS family aminotransferase [Bdellovibrio sp.]
MYLFGEDELKAIRKVVDSKKLFRYQGPGVETESSIFEKEFASYHGANHALVLSSGTNALVLALSSLGVGPGDHVLVPAYTFFATIAAVVQVGATPIVVNIDQHLSIDPREITKKLTPQTKAIIAVHMDGLNCDLASLTKICEDKKIHLIEDVAQAVGGKYKNRSLGTFGKFGCFSFNQDKIITSGEGGAIVTNDKVLFQKSLCAHDTCNQFGLTLKNTYEIETFIGYSMRVSEITGAILREQLKKLDKIVERLRSNKEEILSRFDDSKNIIFAHDSGGDCGTSLHLICQDPLETVSKSKAILNLGLRAGPLSVRPAHCVWQWIHLLKNEKYIHPQLNPQNFLDEKVKYDQSEFASSIDLLSRIIRVEIPYELDLHQVANLNKII